MIRSTKECPCQHTLPYCQQYNNSDQNTLWDKKTKTETATKAHSQLDISPLHVPFFCKTVTFGLQTKSLSFQVKKVTHFKTQYMKLHGTEFMTFKLPVIFMERIQK